MTTNKVPRGKYGFIPKYSEDDLLNHLRELATKLGRTPSKSDIVAAGKISKTTYDFRFGSLRKAQQAAGLAPTKSGNRRKFSDEDLLNHLQVLTANLGRTPAHDDLVATM